jgi:L-fucose mutarotase
MADSDVLKGIHNRIEPDLLHAMAMMGEGESIVIVDRAFPAYTVAAQLPYKRVITISARTGDTLRAILSLLPLDKRIDCAATIMQVDNEPDFIPEALEETIPIIEAAGSAIQSADRDTFMAMALQGHVLVQTQDNRPHGNVILVKGTL